MTTLANAPLRYVLAIVHLTPVKNIQKHLPELQDAFRATYPEFDEAETNTIRLDQGPDGLKVDITPEKIWQFATIDRSTAITIGTDFLVVHCGTQYPGHSRFIERAADAMTMLSTTKELRTVNMKGFGYRYVDLVEPKPEDDIVEYLQAWATPSVPSDPSRMGLQPKQLGYEAQFQAGEANVRFRVAVNPPFTMPPDLVSPFLATNGWLPEVPERGFALIDVDVSQRLKTAIPLDAIETTTHLTVLHQWARTLFDEAVTPKAMQAWRTP